jgi:dihydroorotase
MGLGMRALLIRRGRVLSPRDGIDGDFDILIEDGVIRQVASAIEARAVETLDAGGYVVSPGLIDLHVHLREPGGEESETLETGLRAAVAGGFTSVCPMPNTRPVIDQPEAVHVMIEKAGGLGLARVLPIAAATLGSEGNELTDFAGLVRAGAVAFSDDGKPLKTAALMESALDHAKGLGTPIVDHCEELTLSSGGVVHAGETAVRLGVKGIGAAAEEVCVARDLILAGSTGGRLHIAHLSTAGALEMVRNAKKNNVRVTCEVTPHHFTLTDSAVAEHGTNAKMNPPLRSASHRDALLAGLGDGTVDVIATDHAPHSPALKQRPLASAPFGVIGLETALALGITQLVESGRISLARLIELMSCNPARIIHQPLGSLSRGMIADITVFDPTREWTYHVEEGKSKSRNSPFDGWKFKGMVIATIVGGRVVYNNSASSKHEPPEF